MAVTYKNILYKKSKIKAIACKLTIENPSLYIPKHILF